MTEQQQQQSIFLKLSRVSRGQLNTTIIEPINRRVLPPQRLQQLQNEFDMVDLHRNGSLTKDQMKSYLQDKDIEINWKVLDDVFDTMDWPVKKQQFCSRYLEKEKQLTSKVNSGKYYEQVTNFNRNMFEVCKANMKSPIFGYFSIQRLQLPLNRQIITQTYDLDFLYEDDASERMHQVTIKYFDAAEQSPKILMPILSQKPKLLITVRLLARGVMVAKGFIDIDITKVKTEDSRKYSFALTRDGVLKGQFVADVAIRQDLRAFDDMLRSLQENIQPNNQQSQRDLKHLQYLQYIFGMNPTNAPVAKKQVKSIIAIRWIFFFLLLIGGIICNLFGRYDPLTLVVSLIFLKYIGYVWLREDIILLLSLTSLALLSDCVWIAFSQSLSSQSPINYQNTTHARFISLILIGVKFGVLLFLIITNKATS